MATDQPSNIVLRLGSLQLSDEAIEVLFATLLVQVSKLTRPAGGEGVVVVQLADPSPGAALRAAPRIADQAAKAGLRIDVSVMACDQPAKAAPTPASAGAKATPAPTATRAMAGAPSAALLNDPDRLIFRGRQIWDPTSAPPGTHLPGYIFFSTSATFSECMQRMLLGGPGSLRATVQRMEPGPPMPTLLFLFNATQKALYGLLAPAARGGWNLEPEAWRGSGSGHGREGSPYPAQVRFQVVARFPLPLPRAEVEQAIGTGPGGKLHTELTAAQARVLVSAFIRFNGEAAAPAVAVAPAVAAKTAGSAKSPSTAPASPGLPGGVRPSPAPTATEAVASTRQTRFGVEPPVALRAEAAAVGPPVAARGPASVAAFGPPVAAPGSVEARGATTLRAVQPVAAVAAAAPTIVPTAVQTLPPPVAAPGSIAARVAPIPRAVQPVAAVAAVAPEVVPTVAPAIVLTLPPPLPASPPASMSPLERLQLQMMQSTHPGSSALGTGEGRLPTAAKSALPLPATVHVSETSSSGAVAAAAAAASTAAAIATGTMSVSGGCSMSSVPCGADDDACSGMNRKERRRHLQQQFLQRQVARAAAAASAAPPPGRSGWDSNGFGSNPGDSDAGLCVVCLDNPREMRVNPCGHAVLCEVCTSALRFKLCPSCRGPIGSFSKLA